MDENTALSLSLGDLECPPKGAGRTGRTAHDRRGAKRAGICGGKAWRSPESNPRTACLIAVHTRPRRPSAGYSLSCIGSGECGSKDVIHIILEGLRQPACGLLRPWRELALLGRQRSLPTMPGSRAQLGSCSHALLSSMMVRAPGEDFPHVLALRWLASWLAVRAELFPTHRPMLRAQKRSPGQQLR